MIATGFAAVDVVDVTPAHKKSSIKRSIEPSLSVQNVLPQRNSTRVYLQLGAFQQFQSAETLRDKVSIVLSQAVNVIVGKDNLHRVFVGPFNNPLQIASIQDLLRQRGISEGHIVSKGIDAQ